MKRCSCVWCISEQTSVNGSLFSNSCFLRDAVTLKTTSLSLCSLLEMKEE